MVKPMGVVPASADSWKRGIGLSSSLLISGAIALLSTSSAMAQITPDDTLGDERSQVTPGVPMRGAIADRIDGGAARGVNLFHSFRDFNVEEGGRVYFSNPSGIENILSRVTGNDLSRIMGVLGVDGSANLYLLNPNGILFGPNARLDIAGSFVASTADRFTFPDGSEFSAVDPQAPPLLTVNVPIGLQYGGGRSPQPLVNQGNLMVGGNLWLSGGSVLSTGSLFAPFGDISVLAVDGDVQVQSLAAQSATLFASGNLILPQSQLLTAGDLTLAAMDTVWVRDSVDAPVVVQAGGDLHIQGNQSIDILALNHPIAAFQSGGDMTLASDGIISGDAHFRAGGSFALLDLQGNPGTFVSYYDPVIRVNGSVAFGDYTGVALMVEATGGITGGNIRITGPEAPGNIPADVSPADFDILTSNPALILRAGLPSLTGTPSTLPLATGGTTFNPITGGYTLSEIPLAFRTIGAPTPLALADDQVSGAIPLGSPFNFFQTNYTDVYVSSNGFLTFLPGSPIGCCTGASMPSATAPNATIAGWWEDLDPAEPGSNIQYGQAGDRFVVEFSTVQHYPSGNPVTMQFQLVNNGDVEVHYLSAPTDGGLHSAGIENADGTVGVQYVFDSVTSLTSTAVRYRPLTGNADSIRVGEIDTSVGSSALTDGGTVILEAQGDITITGDITTTSEARDFDGGLVNILSRAGSVRIANSTIRTSSVDDEALNAGAITIEAANDIDLIDSTLDAGSFSTSGSGGNILLRGNNLTLNASRIFSDSLSSSDLSSGGFINLFGNTVTLLNQSLIDASTNGEALGGVIEIFSQDVVLRDSSVIRTIVSFGATGIGGQIFVDADTISLFDGSRLEARTFGPGSAGFIELNTTSTITLDGFDPVQGYSTGIFTSSETPDSGAGGYILVSSSGDLIVRDGAVLSSLTRGQNDGGFIDVSVDNLRLLNGGQFLVTTFGSGDAGYISVLADGEVEITGFDPGFSSRPTISLPNLTGSGTLTEVEANDSPTAGQSLIFPGEFSLSFNPNVESSASIPYVSVSGTGNGSFDYYRFNVVDDNTIGIFDIDDGIEDFPQSAASIDTELFLFRLLDDGKGNITTELLADNDDFVAIAGGEGSFANTDPFSFDSYIRYIFREAGDYVIGVGRFNSFGDDTGITGNAPEAGDTYTLNVSLGASRLFNQGLIPNEGGNSGLYALSSGTGRGGNISVNADRIRLNDQAQISAGSGASPIPIDTELFLFNQAGLLLVENDDRTGDPGSSGFRDSLIDYTFTADGTYIIGVGGFDSFPSGGFAPIDGEALQDGSYLLHVSVANHPLSDLPDWDGRLEEVEGNNTTVFPQNLDNFFVLSANPDVTDSATIPRVSIYGGGDGTFDYYSFTATAGSRGIFDIDDTQGGAPGNVALQATGAIEIRNSEISADTDDAAPGNPRAEISLSGGSIMLADRSLISASTRGSGDAGEVILSATGGQVSLSESRIITTAEEGATGDGGNITIDGERIVLRNNTQIDASNAGSGQGGTIRLETPESGALIISQSQISTAVTDPGKDGATGDGGDIRVRAGSIELSDRTTIEATLLGSGQGGDIVLNALGQGMLELDDSTVSTSALAGSSGTGGDISIQAGSMEFRQRSQITAINQGSGQGGDIDLLARNNGDIVVAGSSTISTAVETSATGDGGDIRVQTGSLNLRNGSRLEALTRGEGDAGDVQILAGERVRIIGENAFGQYSGILTSSETPTSGAGGDIFIGGLENDPLDLLLVSQSGFLNARTLGDADGGNIRVEAERVELTEGGQFITSTLGTGTAGNIEIEAGDRILISGSNPDFVNLQGEGAATGAGILTEVEPNDTRASAQLIAASLFSTTLNPNIDRSDSIPYVSVSGTGNGTFDYYAFDVLSPGSQGIFDIDGTDLDTELFLFDSSGNLLAENDDALIDAGSSTGRNSFISYTFATPDRYIVGVGRYFSSADQGMIIGDPVPTGSSYTLQVSLENRIVNPNPSQFSGLFAQSSGLAPAGSIDLQAETLTVEDRGRVTVNSAGTARAGNLTVDAAEVFLDRGFLTAETEAGRGGNIRLENLEILDMRRSSQITASTQSGVGGDLFIEASDRISLRGNSRLASEAFLTGGQAGSLRLVTDDLLITRGSRATVSARSTATAGNLIIRAEDVRLDDGILSAETEAGQGGNIFLQGLDTLELDNRSRISASTRSGIGGDLEISARDRISLRRGSRLESEAFLEGAQSGSLSLLTGDLTIAGGSRATVSARSTATAGDLTIDADTISLDRGFITAETEAGRGGNIRLQNLESLELTSGSAISASTQGGRGGRLFVDADEILLSDRSILSSEATLRTGRAGDLRINTDILRVEGRSRVTVSNDLGFAGSMSIQARQIYLNNGQLEARTGRSQEGEQGANIELRGLELLVLQNQSLISAQALRRANGGNLIVDAADGFIVAGVASAGSNGSDIIANAVLGQGGQIDIAALGVLNLEERPAIPGNGTNDIDASSDFGLSGTVTITRPDIDPSQGLVELPVEIVDASQLVSQSCQAGSTDDLGEFVITGRGGLPPNPLEPIDPSDVLTDLVTVEEADGSPPPAPGTGEQLVPYIPPTEIIEAQGWTIGANGEVILTASASTPPQQPSAPPIACP